MKASFFISKKILRGSKNDYSRNIVAISVGTIALCVAVMLLSVFIVLGFKHEVERKVVGFIGHARVLPITNNESLESPPLSLKPESLFLMAKDKHVVSLNGYAYKGGIIKTPDMIEGVVLYGIGPDFNKSCFSGKIVKGTFPSFNDTVLSDSVVISKVLADKLLLNVNDRISMYFMREDKPGIRRFVIAGIYESGFNTYDKLYVIGDINHVRKLNGWIDNEVTGYQVFLNSSKNTNYFVDYTNSFLDYNSMVFPYYKINQQVFDWLNLQDTNVILLITLMAVVCAITVISIMIIIIIEKSSMIGVLKALGMDNRSVRTVFMTKSLYLSALGVIIGDVFAIILSLLQKYFSIVKLSQESYYMSTVPVEINVAAIITVNVSALLLCLLASAIPSSMIGRISPFSAIQSE